MHRDDLKIGDIVLTENNNYKRQDCKIGHTKDLMLSRDDKVWVVLVDAIISGKINTIKHPIKKLSLIEMAKGMNNEKIRFVKIMMLK